MFPNLITTVATTDATVTGNQMTEPVHHALAARNLAPGRHYTDSGYQADYARRAGVEGTMSQAASHGARRARYRGLPKTRLDHVYMACALNLLRLEAFWTGTPRDRQRTSHLARLELGLAAQGPDKPGSISPGKPLTASGATRTVSH